MSAALMPSGVAVLGQQQARLEVGEPGRHHQVVGGEFEPQLARLLDEGEVLVGQRQDRDLGQIDLLLARERQQQIERTLETLDVDDQRRLVGRPLGGQIGANARCPPSSCRHPCTGLPGHQLRERRAAPPRDRSRRARVRARERRFGAPRRVAGEQRRLAGDRLHLRQVAVAMQDDVASRRRARPGCAGRSMPDRAPIDTSSLIKAPSNPMNARITCAIIVARSGGRQVRIDRCEHHMRGHRQRQAGERPECGKIGRFERRPVGRRPPAARRGCRRSPAHGRECASAPAGRRPPRRPSAIAAAIAATFSGHRCHRHGRRSPRSAPATGTSASGRQSTVMPSVARSAAISRAPSRAAARPSGRVAIVKLAVGGAGRIGRPMRRSEALHAAALLIDQDGRCPAAQVPEIIDQSRNLVRSLRCCA